MMPPNARRGRVSREPAEPMPGGVDIVYLAWNRLEFTRTTLDLLVENTDWDSVRRLIVYDDESSDGTGEWLAEWRDELPAHHLIDVDLRRLALGSPVAAMNDYLATATADVFAKIDNDIAVPEGWLSNMLDVFDRSGVDLLGMEAGRTGVPGRDGHPDPSCPEEYGWDGCSHIGGVGLMRVDAFRLRPPLPVRGQRFGFTEWQSHYDVPRAWIYPDLMVPQLDRVPVEPWRSLAREYLGRGWQREWPDYSPQWMRPYFDWLPGAQAALLAAGEEDPYAPA